MLQHESTYQGLNSGKCWQKSHAILFDKDGTIIDFKAIWLKWCQKIVKEASEHVPDVNMSEVIKVWGVDLATGDVKPDGLLAMGSSQHMCVALANSIRERQHFLSKSATLDLAASLIDSAHQNVPKDWVRPIPGLPGLIKALYDQGYLLAVVTTDDTGEARKHLNALGLDKYFQVILGCDLVANCKPAPDLVLEACSRLEVSPQLSTVIGDTVGDMRMGKEAGVQCLVGVSSGVTPEEKLALEADLILPSAADLISKTSN